MGETEGSVNVLASGVIVGLTLGLVELIKAGIPDLAPRWKLTLAMASAALFTVLAYFIEHVPLSLDLIWTWLQAATMAMGIHAAISNGMKPADGGTDNG